MVDNTLALRVEPAQIGKNFTEGYNTGIAQQSARMQQEADALKQLATVGLGVMGGDPDGEINPEAMDQALQLLGNNPIAEQLKGNPELLRAITKGSMEVLRYAQDERQFDLAKQKFEAELAQLQSTGGSDETFAMQPTYYKVTDPATGKVVVQFGQMGSRGTFKPTVLPEGAEPAIPVQQLNTETGFVPVDKFGGAPAGAAETPINNLEAARDTAIGKGEGEKVVELPEKKRKIEGALNALERQQEIVGQDIDKAIAAADEGGVSGLFSTGFLGDLTKAVAGTPAYDLAQTLLTIQANVGFDRLQEMRNNSPTGGALGAISDKETALLQAVNGALAQGQSKDQFKANLQRIRDLQAEVLAERKAAFEQDFGGASQPAPAAASGGGDVIDWTEMDWDN